MKPRVDYDRIAAVYAARYQRNDYSGVEQALVAFVADARADHPRILEVGCGAGHWLHVLAAANTSIFGVDESARMLDVARASEPHAHLIRGRAEALPCRTDSCARIFCVNALHHFTDSLAFFREARRVLRPGGGLLTIGLDPHTGRDQWWVYDYFPEALARDRERYLPAPRIRELMEASGFSNCETQLVQHLPREMTVSEAARAGFLDRTSASQLMVISEQAYLSGLKTIHAPSTAEEGERILRSDLRLYGTSGWAR